MEFHGGEALTWSKLESVLSRGEAIPEVVSAVKTDIVIPKSAPVAFAELHMRSSYSFLIGASSPEELVKRAVQLGLSAVGLLDRDGFYGVVSLAEAAEKYGLDTVFGAELTLGEEKILPILCKGPEGYKRLSHLLSDAHMKGGAKGRLAYPPIAEIAACLGAYCYVLVTHNWLEELELLRRHFGDDQLILEYPATMVPTDTDIHLALDAAPQHLRRLVSAVPAAATRKQAKVAGIKQSLRTQETKKQADYKLHPMGASWLRSGAEILQILPRTQLLETSVEIAKECAFPLNLVAPNLPEIAAPPGHTDMSWLTELTWQRARQRYANWPSEIWEKAQKQIRYELSVIQELNFPGYFLIVSDIVDFCKSENILCQGRGSAANSVVCFSLGITNAEPISAQLLFERFLSAERDGPPDIDLDIESTRREIVIQYVYRTYGRKNAAQVANISTYRERGALRDAGRALGYPAGIADGWINGTAEIPTAVAELAHQLYGQPRHLGIHSGGMVICDRPIADVVPTEWARKENRSILQWDKDDCATIGLVKFDLLGLGMLEALHHMIDLVEETTGKNIKLWELDMTDSAVYAMLAKGDAIGVFQVESRAQLNTLPRMKPRCFFDLVIEIALIRPGPIQGGSVHPYLRRRDGLEEITYDHPVLENALRKTLGIPLFQEQLMQITADAAGFSGVEADTLRRAMGSRRSSAKMAEIHQKFINGCKQHNGISKEIAEKLWAKITAFAAYGFPESHAQSFASIVFFSAWFKHYYPAHFCVGLLRAQPMGFYSPQSLIQDARRHGITVLAADIATSQVQPTVTAKGEIQLGLGAIRGIGDTVAQKVVSARQNGGNFSDIADLARRADLSVAQTENLAKAGALESLHLNRRQALWAAGVAATENSNMLPGLTITTAPALPGMSALEILATDIATTGITAQQHPLEDFRAALTAKNIIAANKLVNYESGTRILTAGIVTHRQRPATAGGVTFLGLEDETGLINVVVSPGLWQRHRQIARLAPALIIRGKLMKTGEVVQIIADNLEELPVGKWLSRGSRDFR
ncbi:error-prone DNA polymerase [Corynebacterium caspium]|uniref:error-prone DNA polymerase n=1 Tax=Corynebacterium caspium TaxID=234828 RepID=UPI00036A3F64|nr:error-prone DNA polymerase [Corynebacterium caspium]WKD59772.1 Error-prone DNA polymerase [Corynebacterium caspium DSM 44850]